MTTYNIVYKGNILEGYDIEDVRKGLCQKFSISPEAADQLLNSGRVIIKKNLEENAAKHHGMSFRKLGLNVVLTPCPEPEEPAPRETGEAPSGSDDTPPAPEPRAEPVVKSIKKAYLPFEFSGSGTEYFKIWIVNLILSILTLGIYSAWAKVRRKQYFYGNTSLNSSRFEYLANPVNILKGRIIVALFFGLYSGIGHFFPLANLIMSLLFILILPWLVIRALAFNARNSAYKNIRFGFNGSIKEAAKTFLLFPFLTPFTLGILAPYTFFRQKKFIVENSSYGTTRFTFTATPKDYYNIFFKALIPIVIAGIFIGVARVVFPPVAVVIALALYLYLFAYISVASTNLLYNSAMLEDNRFDADLETKSYLILITTNTLASVLTLGIFYPWAHIRAIRYKLEHMGLEAKGDLDHYIAREQKQVSALGEEAGDFFDLDIGL